MSENTADGDTTSSKTNNPTNAGAKAEEPDFDRRPNVSEADRPDPTEIVPANAAAEEPEPDFDRRPNVSEADRPIQKNSKLSVCALVKGNEFLNKTKAMSFFPSEINLQSNNVPRAKPIRGGGHAKQKTIKKRRKRKRVCASRRK